MSTATLEPAGNEAIHTSAAALRRMAASVLPPELDRRILELGERKKRSPRMSEPSWRRG